jgi:citrate synthase
MEDPNYHNGLEGVVAARTALSDVDGQEGKLLIAGYAIEDLAQNARFEDVAYTLWHGSPPQRAESDSFRRELTQRRNVSQTTMDVLRAAAVRNVAPMDALRMAAATIDLDRAATAQRQAIDIMARFPTTVAAYARLLAGREPLEPDASLSQAANYLYMLNGQIPSAAQARALETYLITVVDHGLNASTFTARVIVSTGSDLVSAIVGAIGALKGPLHGGAPGPALDTVLEIGRPENAERILREKLARGDRLMGFGHRVYKVRDPRADILETAASRLYTQDEQIAGDRALYELARTVEEEAIRLLDAFKPGRKLRTNVEFYTALLLHGLGIDSDFFTATFAIGRTPGWIAHCLEQRAQGRLIRPSSEYVGRRDQDWTLP